jgi:hypothetical protein
MLGISVSFMLSKNVWRLGELKLRADLLLYKLSYKSIRARPKIRRKTALRGRLTGMDHVHIQTGSTDLLAPH